MFTKVMSEGKEYFKCRPIVCIVNKQRKSSDQEGFNTIQDMKRLWFHELKTLNTENMLN